MHGWSARYAIHPSPFTRCHCTPSQTLPGPVPSKVDSLAFAIRDPENLASDDVPLIRDLRLFSSGGGSDLAEWDLDRGCIRVSVPQLHREVSEAEQCTHSEPWLPKVARSGR